VSPLWAAVEKHEFSSTTTRTQKKLTTLAKTPQRHSKKNKKRATHVNLEKKNSQRVSLKSPADKRDSTKKGVPHLSKTTYLQYTLSIGGIPKRLYLKILLGWRRTSTKRIRKGKSCKLETKNETMQGVPRAHTYANKLTKCAQYHSRLIQSSNSPTRHEISKEWPVFLPVLHILLHKIENKLNRHATYKKEGNILI